MDRGHAVVLAMWHPVLGWSSGAMAHAGVTCVGSPPPCAHAHYYSQQLDQYIYSEIGKTETPSADEAEVLLFTAAKTDAASFGESGQIIAQNYAGDYFAEDYVGEARSIS